MIGIADYGSGNLRNVQAALERLGHESVITDDTKILDNTRAVILPGVGAFGDSMDMLRRTNMADFIASWVRRGNYLLGICVGMQMLFERSFEFGEHQGLGFMKGDVRQFSFESLKVPHMGWNELVIAKDSPLIKDIADGEFVYFVHSFYAQASEEDLIAYTEYGVKAAAAVGRGNIFGVQFHPEKSAAAGAKILKNFMELAK